jgi:hypothetical protein
MSPGLKFTRGKRTRNYDVPVPARPSGQVQFLSFHFAFSFLAAFTWNATGTRAFLLSTPEGNRSPEPRSRDPFRRLGSFLIPAVSS